MKALYINLFATLLSIIVFDTAAYWFIPEEKALVFDGYRQSQAGIIGGRAYYPKDYFVKHESRGFDIGLSRAGKHWVDGVTYEIFSNSLGCFDGEHVNYNRYIYFAGDSFTWGYAPFGKKFGTIIEKNTGMPILKCGVTHTGQLHQYEKFTEIVAKVNKLPEAVFVFYYWNDAANDFAHPHSTVIDGWLLDTAVINSQDILIRRNSKTLQRQLKAKLKHDRENIPSKRSDTIIAFLKRYSLSSQLLDTMWNKFKRADTIVTSVNVTQEKTLTQGFYKLPLIKDARLWYTNNPITQKNRSAILAFKRYANLNRIRLEFVLIPEIRGGIRSGHYVTGWYEEFQNFLDANGISYVDLTEEFLARGLTPKDMAWRTDGHYNPNGNKIVAEILMERYPTIFSAMSREVTPK